MIERVRSNKSVVSQFSARAIFCGLGILVGCFNTSAITITYQVEDLADNVGGGDLRKYSYAVTDFEFKQNQGFTIFFDSELYQNLELAPLAPNLDWDILVGEPVPLLGLPGIYDALSIVALGEIASLINPFTISFEWIGAGNPGAQPFEVNEFDENGGFLATLASGQTVAAVATVPETGSAISLFAIGLCGLAFFRRKLTES